MLICIDKFGSEYHATCDSFSLSCPVSALKNFAKNVALRVADVPEVTLWFDDDKEVKVNGGSVATAIHLYYSLGVVI